MKRTKDDADITRQRLIDASLRVFSRDGFAASRLEDIAAAAGVTRGAIAHHFGGKAEIFVALIDERRGLTERIVRDAVMEGGTADERLRRLMTALLERLEDDADYRAMQELALFQRGALPETVREHLGGLHRARTYEDKIGFLLSKGVESGAFRPDLDIPAATRALLGLLTGVSINWLIAPDAYSLKAQAAAIVDTFLRGFARPPTGDHS